MRRTRQGGCSWEHIEISKDLLQLRVVVSPKGGQGGAHLVGAEPHEGQGRLERGRVCFNEELPEQGQESQVNCSCLVRISRGQGVISTTANVAPALMVALTAAWPPTARRGRVRESSPERTENVSRSVAATISEA